MQHLARCPEKAVYCLVKHILTRSSSTCFFQYIQKVGLLLSTDFLMSLKRVHNFVNFD